MTDECPNCRSTDHTWCSQTPGPARTAMAAALGESREEVKSGPVVTFADPLAALGVQDWEIPDPYKAKPEGLYVTKLVKEGGVKVPVEVRFAYAPVFPTLVQVDPDGRQQVQVSWIDTTTGKPQVRRRVVDRSVFTSGRKLIAELGSYGLPVVDGDAKQLERWLLEILTANKGTVPSRYLARQLGWQPDGTFVTVPGKPHPVEPLFVEQQDIIAGFRARGTLAGWGKAITSLKAYPAALMPLYGAFAAPLLRFLGAPSSVLDLYGRSTRGKTTALRIAASVWGDPGEDSPIIGSWRTTMLGIEYRLHIGNGLPAILDDTRTAAEGLVDQVLYQVSQGRGKARGGGWANSLPWQTILLSTGEQSALSMCAHEGASARVMSIGEPPFGTGGADSARVADEVRAGIEANHGSAGPAFVERLQEADPAELKRRWADLVVPLRGESDISARRARNLAVLLLAAELAYEWDIVPFPAPEHARWIELFSAQVERDDRSRSAVEVAAGWVAANRQALWAPKMEDRTAPSGGWIGRLFYDGDTRTVGLLIEPLRRELKRCGVELDAVVHGWIEDGLIVRSEGRPPYSHSKKIDGTQARMVIFTPKAISIGSSSE
ncbi:DUF927 domain-containing protein [Nonomuraea wenchangensis]|uniref:DUF927 domain-containing protein n=1 Tax=Nonomuraea wenchangensis TaxID=568860 RepID=UPI003720FAEA